MIGGRYGLARVKIARLTPGERYALLFAVFVAHGFLIHQLLFPSSLYDAGQYARMGRDLVDLGFVRRFGASVRTYGYPLLLSGIYAFTKATGVPFAVVVFAFQLCLFIGAAWFFRSALARISVNASRIAFSGMMLNLWVLLYTSEILTESLSISLLIITAACWITSATAPTSAWPLLVGSLTAGFSLVVRPANLYVVLSWVLGLVLILWRRDQPRRRSLATAALLVVILCLPSLPQLAYNVLRFGRWTPLVADDLGVMQQAWGVRDIKYATAMPPLAEPKVHYVNPFLAGTTFNDLTPLQWYGDYPVRGAMTIALHTFNLTDQDLLFTYSRDLDPWYRIPLAIVNHGIVALGLVGLAMAAGHLRRAGSAVAKNAFGMVLLVLVGNWGIHALTAVEMRFGLVLLLVWTPFAGYAVTRLLTDRRRLMPLATVGTVAYVVLALILSAWVREQAPLIRDWPAAAMQTTTP
jgi:hypothetical protein